MTNLIEISSESKRFRPEIQALRAVAVISVMLFHLDRQWLPGGYIGVDIFFVISGYLITTILIIQRKENSVSIPQKLRIFFGGRVRRIIPAYFVLLAFVTLVASIILEVKDYVFFKESLDASLIFHSNSYFANFGDYFAPKSDELPLLHLWSLAIEMQFYFFYPFLILLIKEKWIPRIILAILVVSFVVSTQQLQLGASQSTYYALYARIPEFLVGGYAVFINRQSKWMLYLGTLLIAASLWLLDSTTPFPGLYAIPCAVGTLMILIDTHGKSSLSFLVSPLFVWIGSISYSLYLWHWPVLSLIRYTTGSYSLTGLQIALYWILSFVAASASYYWVEQRFRKKTPHGYSFKKSIVFLLLAVSLPIASTSYINRGATEPLAKELTRYADLKTICHGIMVDECLRGGKTKGEPILVLGDSHAAMLNIFFDKIGEKNNNYQFRVITGSACVTITDFDYKRLPETAQKKCTSQLQQIDNYLVSSKTVIIAAMWRYHLKSKKFNKALDNFLNKNRNKTFILLADIPSFVNYNPVRTQHLAKYGLDFQSLALDNTVGEYNEKIKQIANNYSHVHYLNLAKNNTLFSGGAVHNGKIIYHDSHHLNEVGSKLYAKYSQENMLSFLNKLSTERK